MHRRILEIDLSTGSAGIRPLPPDLEGPGSAGRTLAVQLLAAALAGDPLVIAPGALCGSGAPAANRCTLVFTSPLTGTIFSTTEGGAFSLALQGAGFAAVVIRGESPGPVLLQIGAEGGELRDGQPWWGADADACAHSLGASGAGVLAIGPAGENNVLYAGLHAGDGNLFGRGGPGAVLGRKRLKAIVIEGETSGPQPADPPAFARACADLQRLLRASPLLAGPVGFAPFGEAALVDLAARRGLLPSHNFTATFPADASAFNGAAMLAAGENHAFGCGGCPIACKRRDDAGQPLPDFFTLAAGGALLGLPDLAAIRQMNALCNRLGLDPLSLAGTLAAHSEIEGRPLTLAEIEALLPEIAGRRGEGALLADGAARYAAQKGRPEVAMTVRQLELAPLDPRGLFGLALAHAVDPSGRGETALTHIAELLRKPVPVERLSWGGKARLVHSNQRAAAAFETLGLCPHLLYAAGLEEAAALYGALTGIPCDAAALAALGAQTLTTEAELSRRVISPPGMAALPARLFTPALGENHLPTLPGLQQAGGEAEVQRYQRLTRPAPPSSLHSPGEESALFPALHHYAAKIVAEGLARAGRFALLAQDESTLAVGAPELIAQGKAILAGNGAAALCLLVPPWPFADFLQRRAPQATAIVPRDSETRTFLHEIPLLRGDFNAADVAAALGSRKGVVLDGGVICASGALTIEQAYVNASSLWHALYIKYLLDVLTDGFLLPEEAEVFAAFRASALNESHAEGLIFRNGPLATPEEIEAEMVCVGRYTVERHLVDSFFGNISCRRGDDVYISATASSLDALHGCIDPVPFDNRTTLGLVASSELAAHQGIYAATEATTILHGHPRFSVALSMLCADEKDCPIKDCWRDCPKVRYLNNVPIVAGEIGAGGLAKRVPPVIGACGAAIVYGHGVFCIGRNDFAEPFHALVGIERWCREEYFRRLDCGAIFG